MTIHEQLLAEVGEHRGVGAADCFCQACVSVLDVDAAGISLVFDGTNTGTLGASGAPARMYDELQFTLGSAPCWWFMARLPFPEDDGSATRAQT